MIYDISYDLFFGILNMVCSMWIIQLFLIPLLTSTVFLEDKYFRALHFKAFALLKMIGLCPTVGRN